MNVTLEGFLYLLAAALFIRGLKGLTSPATARRGNQLAAIGMLIASVVTLLDLEDRIHRRDEAVMQASSLAMILLAERPSANLIWV